MRTAPGVVAIWSAALVLVAATLLAAPALPAAAQTGREEPTTSATVSGYESGYDSLAGGADSDSEEGVQFDYEGGKTQLPQIEGAQEEEVEVTGESTAEERTVELSPADQSPDGEEGERYSGSSVPDTGGERPLFAKVSGALLSSLAKLPAELLWVGVGAFGAASLAFGVSAVRSRQR